MINQVIFAVSDDESKYAMNGALLEKDGSGLIMVGTDGRRLSYINRRIESEIPDFPKATIPSKFLNLIRKLAVGEGDFEISVNQNSISLRFGSCTISSSLIKNDFPAYKRVIPEHQSRFCTVNISLLSDALKRVSAGCAGACCLPYRLQFRWFRLQAGTGRLQGEPRAP